MLGKITLRGADGFVEGKQANTLAIENKPARRIPCAKYFLVSVSRVCIFMFPFLGYIV